MKASENFLCDKRAGANAQPSLLFRSHLILTSFKVLLFRLRKFRLLLLLGLESAFKVRHNFKFTANFLHRKVGEHCEHEKCFCITNDGNFFASTKRTWNKENKLKVNILASAHSTSLNDCLRNVSTDKFLLRSALAMLRFNLLNCLLYNGPFRTFEDKEFC